MKNQRPGKITYHYGYPPASHELATAEVFAALGKDIEFLLPSRTKNSHTPDIIMDGVMWELKCPMGKSQRNIANIFHKALKQSKNIIIDIRHAKTSKNKILAEINKNADRIKSLKKLKVVGKKNVIDVK